MVWVIHEEGWDDTFHLKKKKNDNGNNNNFKT